MLTEEKCDVSINSGYIAQVLYHHCKTAWIKCKKNEYDNNNNLKGACFSPHHLPTQTFALVQEPSLGWRIRCSKVIGLLGYLMLCLGGPADNMLAKFQKKQKQTPL